MGLNHARFWIMRRALPERWYSTKNTGNHEKPGNHGSVVTRWHFWNYALGCRFWCFWESTRTMRCNFQELTPDRNYPRSAIRDTENMESHNPESPIECVNGERQISPKLGSEQKTHKEKKHVNKTFTGLSRDLGGNFVCVFFSPIRNDPKKTHKKKILPPAQSRDNPANLFMFMCFSFPWKSAPGRWGRTQMGRTDLTGF